MSAGTTKRFGAVEAVVTEGGGLTLLRGGVVCGEWSTPEDLGRARAIDADEQEAMRWGWSALRDRAVQEGVA